jgi:hypothetical protein
MSTTYHRYGFEAWAPHQLTGGPCPAVLQVPDHLLVTATDPAAATERARAMRPATWSVHLTQHIRSQCIPAHPGRDA